MKVTHRRYIAHGEAHYAGNLVDGAHVLALFGDVATELCIHTDGDEGLFASYADVQFRAPVHGGDVLEVSAELVRSGTRSREIRFTAHVVARGAPTAERPGAAALVDPPLLVTEALGTVVVPPRPGHASTTPGVSPATRRTAGGSQENLG